MFNFFYKRKYERAKAELMVNEITHKLQLQTANQKHALEIADREDYIDDLENDISRMTSPHGNVRELRAVR